jgi:hypothetical protein
MNFIAADVRLTLRRCFVAALLAGPLAVAAQDLAGLANDTSRDLEKASAELSALREQIGA